MLCRSAGHCRGWPAASATPKDREYGAQRDRIDRENTRHFGSRSEPLNARNTLPSARPSVTWRTVSRTLTPPSMACRIRTSAQIVRRFEQAGPRNGQHARRAPGPTLADSPIEGSKGRVRVPPTQERTIGHLCDVWMQLIFVEKKRVPKTLNCPGRSLPMDRFTGSSRLPSAESSARHGYLGNA